MSAEYLVGIPDVEAFKPNPSRERLTPQAVATVLKCLVRDDGPKKLELSYASDVMGVTGGEYIMADTDGYALAFFVRQGQITNCFRCLTPKGKEYNAAIDGGQPVCNFLEVADWFKLDKLIRGFSEKPVERKLAVREFYQIIIDAGTDHWSTVGPMYDKGPTKEGVEFPRELMKMHARFYDKTDAEKVMSKLQKYLDARNKELEKSRKKK